MENPGAVRWSGERERVRRLPIHVPMTSAEEQSLDLNAPDVLKHQLEQQIGTRVKVRLEG